MSNNKQDFSIEDILLEAQKLREKSSGTLKQQKPSTQDEVDNAVEIARELMKENAAKSGGSRDSLPEKSKRASFLETVEAKGEKSQDISPSSSLESPQGERKPLSFRRKKQEEALEKTEKTPSVEKKKPRKRGPLTFGFDEEILPLDPRVVLEEKEKRKGRKSSGKQGYRGIDDTTKELNIEKLLDFSDENEKKLEMMHRGTQVNSQNEEASGKGAKLTFQTSLPEIYQDPKFATGALEELGSLQRESVPPLPTEQPPSFKKQGNKGEEIDKSKHTVPPASSRRTSPTRRGEDPREAKLDLFDFKPKKREMPLRKGPFGQKHFDFKGPGGKPSPIPPNPAFPREDQGDQFDFASISGKIEQMQQEEYHTQQSVRTKHNPLDFTGAVNPITEKSQGGLHKYAHLATKDGRFQFGDKEPHRAVDGAGEGYDDIGNTLHPEDRVDTHAKKRRSIFSTFPTGTGKELKIEDIKQIDFGAVEGSGSGYYDDQEYYTGEDMPEGSFLQYNEFGPKSDRRDVLRDISSNKMSIFVRTALTAFLTILLIYLGFSAKFEMFVPSIIYPEKSSLPNFLLFCTILTALVGVVCGNTVVSGISSVFRMRANSDSLASFALMGAVFQGFIAFRNPDLIDPQLINLYFPAASLAMLFNCIGKLTMLDRIQRNFRVTAARQDKRGAISLGNTYLLRELLPQSHSKPTVALSTKADFFTDFMALSYSNKYDVGIHRSVAPVSILGAFIVGIATRFLTSDSFLGASAFAGVLCISATFSSTFIESIPLGKLAKKLTPMGAMVSGNKAVEEFCDTNAIILTEKDLFPKGHVYLNGIKAFPGGRIDEAILDAASVLCALDGALSHVFLDMIGGNKQLLKKVDNVVYENSMGLSGWVDGRRVLIGNRELMKNHGVDLPSDTYERKNPIDSPGNPIYLSNSGIVSARFQVEYTIDEQLAYQLDLLAQKEIKLVIYTTDANINPTKIWEIYGYPLDLISTVPSELQDNFREEAAPRTEMPAEIVYTGKPASLIAAIIGTINVRASILSATVVQLIQIIFGYGLVTLMSFMGYIGEFSMVKMIAYQLFWFVAIFIIQQTRKP